MEHRNDHPVLPALPVEVWSTITSYATSPASECNDDNSSPISALRCASRRFRRLLSSDTYYRARVAETLRALDECRHGAGAPPRPPPGDGAPAARSAYPRAADVGGHANLLRVLVRCAPLEGWYTVADAWPWWLLVRVRFADGRLCGDVVSASVAPHGGAGRTAERVFAVSFDGRGRPRGAVAGRRAERVGVRWKGDGGGARDAWQPLHARAPAGHDASFPHHNGLLFQISDIWKGAERAPAAWPGQVMTNYGFGASVRSPPPTSALIEQLLRRDTPLKTNRPDSESKRRKSYYQNDLVFEYLYAIQGRPLINGKEVKLEELVIGHNLKSF